MSPPKTPPAGETCRVCSRMEPETIDRLFLLGYGPRFVGMRWGLPRWRVKKHRDECLVGERRRAVEDGLRLMASKRGGSR
jgi:hypothetical protein